jgi:hypothetical protein
LLLFTTTACSESKRAARASRIGLGPVFGFVHTGSALHPESRESGSHNGTVTVLM